MFKNAEKTALQEIGPRFTLKLHSLKEGLPKGAGVWDGKYGEEYELTKEEVDAMQSGQGEEEGATLGDGVEGEGEVGVGAGKKAKKEKEKKEQEGEVKEKLVSGNKKKRQRGEEETTGLDFQWKPKMSVSRRNFYL